MGRTRLPAAAPARTIVVPRTVVPPAVIVPLPIVIVMVTLATNEKALLSYNDKTPMGMTPAVPPLHLLDDGLADLLWVELRLAVAESELQAPALTAVLHTA